MAYNLPLRHDVWIPNVGCSDGFISGRGEIFEQCTRSVPAQHVKHLGIYKITLQEGKNGWVFVMLTPHIRTLAG